MTGDAIQAIKSAEYIIGNSSYLTSLAPFLEGKEVIRSSMGKEVERAQQAVDLARNHVVAMVSGGDPGVYGMASIVLEVLERNGGEIDVRVIPGVTAANAAASRVGSPLSGDFCVISLSDLLTPLPVIEQRLRAAFSMGIPVVLYNPKSRGRPHNLSLALGIALEHHAPGNPCCDCKKCIPGRGRSNSYNAWRGTRQRRPGGYALHRYHRGQRKQAMEDGR